MTPPVVAAYLSLVDSVAPGLVEGLYLVGSVALGDYRPGHSDVDFVAVTSDRPDPAVLSRVHARLAPRPYFDGPYVTWEDLARPPDEAGPVPYAHRGAFVPSGDFELNPATWQTLARAGVAARGPAVSSLDVWTDRAVLAEWARENLRTYWRGWHDRSARLVSRAGLVSLGSWATQWGALGVARQHHLIGTGEVISKTDAGRYALRAFDARWRRIARESLRLREGVGGRPGYRTPVARRRDLLDFVAMVVRSA